VRRRLLAAATVLALTVAVAPVSAYRGAPGFLPGIVYDQNFPDPHVIVVDGIYIAYGTNTGGPKIPTLLSLDLETWVTRGAWGPEVGDTSPFGNDTLVTTPSWAARTPSGNEVWAPAVVETTAGWRAYYTIRAGNGSRPLYCLSVASGPGPLGPFHDTSTEPLTCGYGPAGAIDPWVYVDDVFAVPWLIWKVEPYSTTALADDDRHFPLDKEDIAARPPGTPPRFLPGSSASMIWAQPLDATATRFAENSSARVLLRANTSGWERGIIENPAMYADDDGLHLLYSGNRWGSPDYATGWARCDTPLGPCRRAANGPIHASSDTELGPGAASVFVDNHGELRVAYHAWNAPYSSYPSYPGCDTDGDQVCRDEGQRFLHTDVLCTLPGGERRIGLPGGWRFCDTDANSWRGQGVAWLSDTGITTGVSPNYFAPDRTITRAEVVTLLWRWAGSPRVAGPAPFDDLRTPSFYTDAVAWAAVSGIVRGTSPTTFDPDAPITRGQVAAILHRAAGSPAPGGTAPFRDVPGGTYYTTPVAWMAETGVTTGITPTTYGPAEASTRAQFAVMLCRAARLALDDALVAPAVEPCPT
jgi:hypothetical protein